MGRTVGWLALHAGVAGGGDVILLPEIPFHPQAVYKAVEERHKSGKRFSIIVVAEGVKPFGGESHYVGKTDGSGRKLLGGIGQQLAADIEDATGLDTRVTTLGHLQRGGSPSAFDRVLATQFGHTALELVMRGDFGKMVALKGHNIESVTLDCATRTIKSVPIDHPLIAAARSVGTIFGDEIKG
jgi:6-phosphofructokinase 1